MTSAASAAQRNFSEAKKGVRRPLGRRPHSSLCTHSPGGVGWVGGGGLSHTRTTGHTLSSIHPLSPPHTLSLPSTHSFLCTHSPGGVGVAPQIPTGCEGGTSDQPSRNIAVPGLRSPPPAPSPKVAGAAHSAATHMAVGTYIMVCQQTKRRVGGRSGKNTSPLGLDAKRLRQAQPAG